MTTSVKVFTVTVATNGLSAAVPLEGYTPFAIQSSTALTGTTMTFQATQDESNYFNVYKDDGGEYSMTVGANRYVVFTSPEQFIGLRALKVRMGTSTAASTQAAARTMKIVARAL